MQCNAKLQQLGLEKQVSFFSLFFFYRGQQILLNSVDRKHWLSLSQTDPPDIQNKAGAWLDLNSIMRTPPQLLCKRVHVVRLTFE